MHQPNPNVSSTQHNQVLNDLLLSVDVPLVGSVQCNASYGGLLDAAMICAGDTVFGGRDSCQGDSGGPMVCNGLLTGIVSFGSDCGTATYPGVYVNVSHYREWILANSGAERRGGHGAALLVGGVMVLGLLARIGV